MNFRKNLKMGPKTLFLKVLENCTKNSQKFCFLTQSHQILVECLVQQLNMTMKGNIEKFEIKGVLYQPSPPTPSVEGRQAEKVPGQKN